MNCVVSCMQSGCIITPFLPHSMRYGLDLPIIQMGMLRLRGEAMQPGNLLSCDPKSLLMANLCLGHQQGELLGLHSYSEIGAKGVM